MVAQNIIEAFNTMWGPFPEPVLLVHKNRTILAVNALASQAGMSAGVKCFSFNPAGAPDGHCRGCKANQALRAGQAVSEETPCGTGDTVRAYWMPLKEEPEIYVHFGIGTAEAMKRLEAEAAASPA